jgi:hypothetical protein
MKEQVSVKWNAVCAHRCADFLLKNSSAKHSKYVVNQKLEHVDDINFRELFGRIRVVLAELICFADDTKYYIEKS